MSTPYEVHFQLPGHPWTRSNLGTFDTPDEAQAASADWLTGYRRARPHDDPAPEVRVMPAGHLERLAAAAPDLLAALEAAVERMEAVAEGIPVHNRAAGVSAAVHVARMASRLAQHARIARAAIAKATTPQP